MDGRRRMGDVGDEGRTADVAAVEVAWLDIEVFRQLHHAHRPHGHRCPEESIDIREFESCIVQGFTGALPHDLKRGLVRCPATLVFVDTGDGDLA